MDKIVDEEEMSQEEEINQETLAVMKILNKYYRLGGDKMFEGHQIAPIEFNGIPDYVLILDKLVSDGIILMRQTPNQTDYYENIFGMSLSETASQYEKDKTYKIGIIPGTFDKYYASLAKTKTHKTENETCTTRGLSFNSNQSKLIYDSMVCDIPRNSLEYFTCKLVFESPASPVEETDITDEAEKGEESQRPVYDAVTRINKKAKKAFGIDKILDFKAGAVSIIRK